MSLRVYLDHNATMPLRPEARAAMIDAMDIVGNPSSVHSEGRAAKALLERSRIKISELLGAQEADIVFTSGATEAADLALGGRDFVGAPIEHDAVGACINATLAVGPDGGVAVDDPNHTTLQLANSETGVIQKLPEGLAVVDFTQAVGKIPVAFGWSGAKMGLISAHKFGGPKGVGAVLLRRGLDLPARIKGGGQEMGRRSGTENIIGIVGLAAALKAADEELNSGIWDEIAEFRNILEIGLHSAANKTIFVGKGAHRLPNTSCILTPSWKGETQVMQMDLAGFAISAGSACSSGKVRASRVLQAMGYDDIAASSAIRVSLGPRTTRDEIDRFADAWLKQHEKFRARAA
jgi:cysteine desulfurase